MKQVIACIPFSLSKQFYLTYEELKPLSAVLFPPMLAEFYLTYEELKPVLRGQRSGRVYKFYLTYEELKLGSGAAAEFSSFSILSYL